MAFWSVRHREKIQPTDLAKRIVRPQDSRDELQGYRQVVQHTPVISDVYNHYRRENLFYELGLAHALHKPVVLVSSNEADVPFDLKHIRVIYYDVSDPFWGSKLIEKVAENVLSALKNPEEAIFKAAA
jgi:hypothetical protein